MIKIGGGSGSSQPAAPASTENSYTIDLVQWGINNDDTNPITTTAGINSAILWASQNGYTEVVFPYGTYRTDENSHIIPRDYMTLNLNGSTFKINPNSLESYRIMAFNLNQKFCRITNGKIQGDRIAHTYEGAGTHEAGYGISVGTFYAGSLNNVKIVRLDNLEIFDCTGDAIGTASNFNQILPVTGDINTSFEAGKINTATGALEASTNDIRSTLHFSMTQSEIVANGYFGIYGNGYGSLGSEITTNYYDIIFYRVDNSFISSEVNVEFFDEVRVPADANYAMFVLHQSTIPTPAECLFTVRVPKFPEYVWIEKCNLHHCRRLGISPGGIKHLYVRDNEIHDIGGSTQITGTNPNSGIDIEEGYGLNKDIHIENNNFHHNYNADLIVVGGYHINVNSNKTTKSIVFYGAVRKSVFSDNVVRGGTITLDGEVNFDNNQVYQSFINVGVGSTFHLPIQMTNTLFNNCKIVLNNQFRYNIILDGCKFYNDADKIKAPMGAQWTIEFSGEAQIIKNCTIEGNDILYATKVNTTIGKWIFENVMFYNMAQPGLPGGTYTNCKFIDISFISVTATTTYDAVFNKCLITSTDNNNVPLTINNCKSFRFLDSVIEKVSGWVLKIQNVTDNVVIKNSEFKQTAAVLTRNVITVESTFTGTQIVIEGSMMSSSNAPLAIDNLTSNSPEFIIRNNICKGATLSFGKKEIMENNIVNGVIDPYLAVSAEPTTGFYKLGQKLRYSTPTAGGYIGLVTITEGTAEDTAWIATTVYALDAMVKANNKVYKCTVAGTSGNTAPSHTSGTAIDGTVTWLYIDVLAAFKQYGAISA